MHNLELQYLNLSNNLFYIFYLHLNYFCQKLLYIFHISLSKVFILFSLVILVYFDIYIFFFSYIFKEEKKKKGKKFKSPHQNKEKEKETLKKFQIY